MEDAAKTIFNVWSGQPELKFAETAWKHLEQIGLANYDTPLEETRVKIRLMALSCVYLDFCAAAKDEENLPEFSDWSDALGIELFRVAQLVGTKDTDCNEAQDDCEFRDRALTVLADRCRLEIHRALVRGYGDANKLYSALWHSCEDEPEVGGQQWEMAGANSIAYGFVTEGFIRERTYF